MVDTGGLLLVVLVTAASVQDRDGGVRVLERAKMAMHAAGPVLGRCALQPPVHHSAHRALGLAVQVVTKLVGQHGFPPLPRRWVVERTHAWRCPVGCAGAPQRPVWYEQRDGLDAVDRVAGLQD